jgi:phage shock protein C
MFCPHCGKPIEDTARFCAACGTAIRPAARVSRPLLRPREGRMLAGICAAFALAYGWDVTLVRIIAAAMLFLSAGTIFFGYLILWIIIPQAPYALPDTTGTLA